MKKIVTNTAKLTWIGDNFVKKTWFEPNLYNLEVKNMQLLDTIFHATYVDGWHYDNVKSKRQIINVY